MAVHLTDVSGPKNIVCRCDRCYYETGEKTIRTLRQSKMPVTMKFFSLMWKALASAPHRLFFLGGACQGIAAMLWWLLELSGRFGGFYPVLPWMIPPVWAHAYLMIYGFFPFFIFGFLFTFFPNWLDAESIPPRDYLLSFLGIGSGTGLFYVGLIFSKSILLSAVI